VSLLAMASVHPTLKVTDRPLSRAGSLPQECVASYDCGYEATCHAAKDHTVHRQKPDYSFTQAWSRSRPLRNWSGGQMARLPTCDVCKKKNEFKFATLLFVGAVGVGRKPSAGITW